MIVSDYVVNDCRGGFSNTCGKGDQGEITITSQQITIISSKVSYDLLC